MVSSIHKHQTTQTALTSSPRRTTIARIGSKQDHDAFTGSQSEKAMILSLCDTSEPLHLEAIALADKIQVLGESLDAQTLHELCSAHNLDKPITWLADRTMYCPRCRKDGPESEHFFHNPHSLHDLNMLLSEITAEHLPYLCGQTADWYGQVVPVALLSNGNPALQIDLSCARCERYVRTAYAIAGAYDAWTTLLEADGTFLLDLCNADERAHTLICQECLGTTKDKVGHGK